MQTITTIGFDIAKSVFQVHGVDSAGEVVIRRQLKRRYVLAFFQKLSPCLVGIEACASSHYWSRELQALGHSVRLMPPAYVKPYVIMCPRGRAWRMPSSFSTSMTRRWLGPKAFFGKIPMRIPACAARDWRGFSSAPSSRTGARVDCGR